MYIFRCTGLKKRPQKGTLTIMIANVPGFFPLRQREKLFPPLYVHKGLYIGCPDIYFRAQRNFSKFEGVGSQKRPPKGDLTIMIANVPGFFPLRQREKLFPPLYVHKGLYIGCPDIYFRAQRNFSKIEGVGCQKRRKKGTIAIMIAIVPLFFPLRHREKLFPPLYVHKGLYIGCPDIYVRAQRNLSKFEGVGSQKRPQKGTLTIMIANVQRFFPLR